MIFDPENVHDEEWLYRSIKPGEILMTPKKRLTSAAFKCNDGGTSVQRDGFRAEAEVLVFFEKYFSKHNAIVKIATKACRDIGAVVKAINNKKDIYHVEIHESDIIIEISSFKLFLLAKKAEIVRN